MGSGHWNTVLGCCRAKKKFVLKRRNAGENVTLNTAVSRACTVGKWYFNRFSLLWEIWNPGIKSWSEYRLWRNWQSKILIHIAQLLKNCFASCKAIQFYTMSFHFFSSGFDKKKHQYLTSKISHCGSQCETLSCLCTYPVVVVCSRERTKEKEKNMPLCKKILVCFALCTAHWGQIIFEIGFNFSNTFDFKRIFQKLQVFAC